MSKKKNGKTKDLAVPNKDETALAINSDNNGVTPGLENIDSTDIVVPRLTLLQALSDGVDSDDPKAPKPGQYMNTLTREAYETPIEIVPIYYNKAAILFGENKGDPPVCQSRDGKHGNFYGLCEKCDYNYKLWVEGEPPKCTVIHEFISVFANVEPGAATPFIISMMKTAAKIAKKWLSAAKFAGQNVPLFGVKYRLDREKVKSKQGDYYLPSIAAAGRIDPNPYNELYQMLKDAHDTGAIVADVDDVFGDSDDDESDIPI